MKFFTRRWHNGELSDAETVGVVDAYAKHIGALPPAVPAALRQLATNMSLHDGLIRRINHDRSAAALTIALRCGELQDGYFDTDLEYSDVAIDSAGLTWLQELARDPEAELLYDEIDLAPNGCYAHRILFWPDGEVEIVFRRISIQVTPRSNREIVREGFTSVNAKQP